MGGLCCCLESAKDADEPRAEANVKTPLLSGQTSAPASGRLARSDSASTARQFAPPSKPQGGSQEKYAKVEPRPTRVSSVDKRLQDHAKLYNDILEKRNTLMRTVNEFKTELGQDSAFEILDSCFKELKTRLGEVEVKLKRKQKHCMEIEFDPKDMPDRVIPALTNFNKANTLIRDIIDKTPSAVESIQLVVKEEDKLRREIMAASLKGDGPDALKNCMENVGDLRRAPEILEEIKKESNKTFDLLVSGARLLFEEEDILM
ncbi:uncharacterized protein LOC106168197 [Lingula anatina]|uniref:Uncharacterized protein LOC106168197 n=1 Tax=Lingula anatina TaxID=7574 RepID=A0A1S3IWQ0_LINAN|nr:uncharacterized protein LOC106168197 [Lingula anatina]|eukprot:XP_013402617.1 uncharacterized protein LOC106168197 [Lingula anatina]